MARNLIAIRKRLKSEHRVGSEGFAKKHADYIKRVGKGRVVKISGQRSRYIYEIYDAHERLLGRHSTAADVAKTTFRGALTPADVEDLAVSGTRFWGCRVRRSTREKGDIGASYSIILRPADDLLFLGLADLAAVAPRTFLRHIVLDYINRNKHKLAYEVAGRAGL